MPTEDHSPAGETDDLRSALTDAFSSVTELPPDPTPEATSLAPPVDDSDDTIAQEAAAERARDEKGRFAKAVQEAQEAANTAEQPQDAAKAAEAAQQAQEAQQPATQEGQPAAPGQRPPPGWSPAAKSEFDKLSPAVREAVVRREDEVNRGLAKLAEYKGLDPYVTMARSAGTDLPQALERYVAAEQFLERSPVEGLLWLAQNYGITPQALVQAMGSQPAPQQQPYQQGMPQAAPATIPPAVMQEIAALRQEVSSVTAERRQQVADRIDSALDKFLNDPANRYAENVAGDMAPLINARRQASPKESFEDTLAWAYQKAVWANDEIRPLLLNEQVEARTKAQQQAVQKAKNAARSVVGAPSLGAPESSAADVPLRDQIRQQLRAGRA